MAGGNDDGNVPEMQVLEVPAIEGNRDFYRELLRAAFTNEVLAKAPARSRVREAYDPDRMEHYMEVMDFLVATAYTMTQPDGNLHVAVGDSLREEMELEPEELQILLGGMEQFGLITQDESGIRIGRRAVEMIPPRPKEQMDG